MKVMKALMPVAGSIVLLLGMSCNNPNDKVREEYVDSTNIHGTAPVRHGAANPADTASPLSSDTDSGRRANTSTKEGE